MATREAWRNYHEAVFTQANIALELGVSSCAVTRLLLRVKNAGGTFKHKAILAGLRGGFITDIVTDEFTANFLLKQI